MTTTLSTVQLPARDVAVIGAGPVGLFAVFACGMVGLSCAVFDSLDHIGGQCTALYPEKPIYDIPGHPDIRAEKLVDNLERQAAAFRPDYYLGRTVATLSGAPGDFTLMTHNGETIRAKSILIAGGAGSFGPQRPPLDGLDRYEGKSVFYAVRDREKFAGKKIVIAGGGDSAVDWAVSLAETAASITLVHRRPKFRAHEASLDRLNALAGLGRINLAVPAQLHGLKGEGGNLSAVVIADDNGVLTDLEADILLPFFGLSATLGPLADWGLGIDKNQIATDPGTGRTSAPGIYAVGDIATYPHKLKLILTGFAESAQAAHDIRALLNPGVEFHHEHSTTKGLPGGAAS